MRPDFFQEDSVAVHLRVRTLIGGSLALALVLFSTGSGMSAAGPQRAAAAAGAGTPRVRALLISAGAFHNYSHQSMVMVRAINRALPVDWTVALQGSPTGTATRYPVYDSPDWAKGYDIVIHNECSADVADPEFIGRITSAHRNDRVPAMVIHCAMHSYRAAKVDDWREFLGVTTRAHSPQFRIPVKWSADPIVAGLNPNWVTPMDELYVIEKVWPGVRPLATAVDYRDQREFPVVWVHEYNGVRVFGTTLGHDVATWDDPDYQALLVRGFKWATGRD
jgi:type 1 glutamine amidotransferase